VVFSAGRFRIVFYVAERYAKLTLMALSLKVKVGCGSAALARESIEDEHFVTMQQEINITTNARRPSR
jgi:hypothetical protein